MSRNTDLQRKPFQINIASAINHGHSLAGLIFPLQFFMVWLPPQLGWFSEPSLPPVSDSYFSRSNIATFSGRERERELFSRLGSYFSCLYIYRELQFFSSLLAIFLLLARKQFLPTEATAQRFSGESLFFLHLHKMSVSILFQFAQFWIWA